MYYVHADHLGSPRAITRPANDAIVWKWDNTEPFGANAANENPSGLGAFRYDLRFPGQQYDAETGTNYNYFRDYDPTVGRYRQSDPIGLWGGLNTYAYAESDPLSLVDPEGKNIHGNWCGPGGKGPALDSVDQCCREHDACYDKCGGTWKNHVAGTGGPTLQSSMRTCDLGICHCLKNTKPEPNTAEGRAKLRVAIFFGCIGAPGARSRNPRDIWR